jgi:dUTPase
MMTNPIFKFALREDLKDNKMFLPTLGEPNATGYDVRAAQEDRKDIVLHYGQYFKIPLGFRAIPEDGWWYQLHPRSSTFAKKNLHGLIGIIDQDFPLEVMFAGQYLPEKQSDILTISFGEKIGQIIPYKKHNFVQVEITNEEYDLLILQKNAVRVGGFGSTTVKDIK